MPFTGIDKILALNEVPLLVTLRGVVQHVPSVQSHSESHDLIGLQAVVSVSQSQLAVTSGFGIPYEVESLLYLLLSTINAVYMPLKLGNETS